MGPGVFEDDTMPMDTFQVTATITFESEFTVEARDEESAERKLRRLLNAVGLYAAIEGRSDRFSKACEKHDVDGPHNSESLDRIDVDF
jgi:hypothetical protein